MRQHQEVTVFVDDYVQDRLPGICVVTGERTNDRLRYSTIVDRPSPGWLILILLGPVGWVILLGVLAFGQRSYLVGQLPMTEAAYLESKRRERKAIELSIAGVVAFFAALLFAGPVLAPAIVAALAIVIFGVVRGVMSSSRKPVIVLDATRRFATLRRVHPAFVDAAKTMDTSFARS